MITTLNDIIGCAVSRARGNGHRLGDFVSANDHLMRVAKCQDCDATACVIGLRIDGRGDEFIWDGSAASKTCPYIKEAP